LIMVVSLAVVSGCSKAAAPEKAPAVPAAPEPVTTPAVVPVAGVSDLVITRVWLEGSTINYTIKNIGVKDSPQTYSNLSVNGLSPASGNSSFVDVLKPGQEKLCTFSNYEWTSGKVSGAATPSVTVNAAGYVDMPLSNNNIKVCADAKSEAAEAVETNNCKVAIIGILWDYELLTPSNLATWRNGDGDYTEPGSEGNVNGAHFKIANADMGTSPQLETIPQQVPQGWMQGIWGYFYADESGSRRMAAIKLPAKLHFVARVGLAANAIGSDGVTFKFGLKDLNDTVTWVASKKVTTPGAFEDWDVNLSDYEGQKDYFILRVDAGESPVNDFAIWNQARLVQVND
jgi:hypothetical protein